MANYTDLLLNGTLETLYMTLFSTLFAYVLGLPLGILLVITDKSHIMPNQWVHSILGWVVNMVRSIPFMILMPALFTFTRFLIGRAIGPTAAIIPLVIGAAPFVARLVESALTELDQTLIETSITMGATKWQVISKIMLPEAFPSIIRGLSIATITLISYSAMAGVVGGGGLGDIAIRYGFHRYDYTAMLLTIIILIVIVQIIQFIFDLLTRKIDKKY
jgi:D-methionine transport system permease protein